MDRKRPRGFFSMPAADAVYAVSVLLLSSIALLPWAREIRLGGMALTGWLLAGLMVFAPAVALLMLLRER